MLFNGSSSVTTTTGLGGVTASGVDRTFACIVNRTSSAGFRNVMNLLTSAPATAIDMTFNGTTMLIEVGGIDSASGPTVGTGKMYLAWDKATGSNTPRFHKQIYGTDAAVVHSNGSKAIGDTSGTPTKIGLGAFDTTGDWFAGDIYVAAIWNRRLSDLEHELAASTMSWHFLNPDWMVYGDWGTLPTNIPDHGTNGGAPLTTLTNMAVSTASNQVGWGAAPMITHPGGGATPVTAARDVTYDILNAITSSRALSYDILNSVVASRQVWYDILNSVTASRQLSYDILNQVLASRAVTYDIANSVQAPRTLLYDIGDVTATGIAEWLTAHRSVWQPTVYTGGKRQ